MLHSRTETCQGSHLHRRRNHRSPSRQSRVLNILNGTVRGFCRRCESDLLALRTRWITLLVFPKWTIEWPPDKQKPCRSGSTPLNTPLPFVEHIFQMSQCAPHRVAGVKEQFH